MRKCLVKLAIIFLTTLNAHAQPAPEPRWVRMFGDSAGSIGLAIEACPAGGYLLGGTNTEHGTEIRIGFLVRVDANGDSLWTHAYPFLTTVTGVLPLADGGFLFCGQTQHDSLVGAGSTDGALVRTDAQGDTLWMRRYDSGSEWQALEDLYAVRRYPEGDLLTVGMTQRSGQSAQIFAARADSGGVPRWQRTYELGNVFHPDKGFAAALTADGGALLVGKTSENAGGGFALRLDAVGDSLWSRIYPYPTVKQLHSVVSLADGGFIVSGVRADGEGGQDLALVMRLAGSGDTLWTRAYSNTYLREVSGQCRLHEDSTILLVGYADSDDPQGIMLRLRKLDLSGHVRWLWSYWDSAALLWQGVALCPADGGGWVVTGGILDPGGPNGMKMLALSTDTDAAAHPSSPLQPLRCQLQNYPNPFNSVTEITFSLLHPTVVDLEIYDLLGRKVRSLIGKERLMSGRYTVPFVADHLPSGTYVCRLSAGEISARRMMILLK